MTSTNVAGLLSDPARRRLFSAVALGAGTPAEACRVAGISAREATDAMRRLLAGGLFEEADGVLRVSEELLRELSRVEPSSSAVEDHGTGDEHTESVLRTFVRDGRLVKIPAQFGRREVVLRHLALRDFRPGQRYTEAAVNELLSAWCEGSSADHVTIRRYLIDFCILGREDGGDYWLYESPPGAESDQG